MAYVHYWAGRTVQKKIYEIWKYLMISLYFIHSFTKAYSKSEATGVFKDAQPFPRQKFFPRCSV